ncbi:hypothetical protein V1517DRAFT_376569 [Lipomyces orientalis]|uniref:Uncharacterized protein n=1 Tax=Lipomyces orientalis TaxID=1233043 RepID=A0ACC3TEP8_9ASCO
MEIVSTTAYVACMSAQLLIAERDGYHLIEGLQEPGVSLAFTTPGFSNEKYSRGKMTEIFIDSTFSTIKHGYELYCVLVEYDLVSLPLSYLLLDTRSVKEDGKRGIRLTRWFAALRREGLNPNVVHTHKDFAGNNFDFSYYSSLIAVDHFVEVTAASIVFKPNNPAKSRAKSKTKCMIQALPEYLRFLADESDWILSKGQNKRCSAEQGQTLRSMIKRHLLRHPLLPQVVDDKKAAPGTLQFESYEEIHSCSVREMLEYCRSINRPKLFCYFWANWYRPSFGNVGSRWEIASLCGRRGSDAPIPISRTTMRLESRWRILKKDYASRFTRPRLDILTYIICTGLVPSRMHFHAQVEARSRRPSAYDDFVHLWRVCASAIGASVISDRDEVYHADHDKWHLVSFYCSENADGTYIVRAPPSFRPDLFQETLPLLRFDASDLIDDENIRSGAEVTNADDNGTGAEPPTYAEELESFQLLPSENPESVEENDEEFTELLPILGWTVGASVSNPRMQQDMRRFITTPASYIAHFKRPYEEALGQSRSEVNHTMRKAPKTYYYMRPQNQHNCSSETR